jgi:hypothetical protein
VLQPYEYTYVSSAPYTWAAPLDGKYQFELWGAEGGDSVETGSGGFLKSGKGGYIKARKQFAVNSTLYLYTGAQGNGSSANNGGSAVYGGGGAGGNGINTYIGGGSGGGASFVSTVSNTSILPGGAISDVNVRSGFQLAAGGGGGAGHVHFGGRGSGTGTGGNGYIYGGNEYTSGASSSVGMDNGIGQAGRDATSFFGNGAQGAGGGGYKGGAAQQTAGTSTNAGGGGGNGYINTTAGWTLLDTDRTGNIDTGEFKDIPEPDGTQAAGHSGAGFIRITYIGQ